jgi:acyl carrier protein
MTEAALDRRRAASLILECFADVVGPDGARPKAGSEEETPLLGPGSTLDSLGLVTLIVDVEQRLATDYDVSVTLASESAMSRRSSPFRTVGSFADYICELKDSQPDA